MHSNNRNPYPPVFTVDASGCLSYQQHHRTHAARSELPPVPCWSFPPARVQAKRRSCGGMSSAAGTLLVMVLLTVFAALGLGAYQIMTLQKELMQLKRAVNTESESSAPQMLVGHKIEDIKDNKHAQAAHLTGKSQEKGLKTLKWESRHGRAFTDGILYSNGGLLVNETGLYFVYSHVEFLFNDCKFRESLSHIVYIKRENQPLTLMKDHRQGVCRIGSQEVWIAGSNLGSMQQLQKDDWVFVNVSRTDLLSNDHQSNYFGLFKLP
ncbi:tumor necrosis factor ligand superfamily member 6 [Trichomycterus rosablanca]|uniref:tumor necrosis factor ligand superfamily member 6 n=1 Tax=Trichomycterus rosablanca TaxID=2290929 RepID=UPI002F35E819